MFIGFSQDAFFGELFKILGALTIGSSVSGIVSIIKNRDFQRQIEVKLDKNHSSQIETIRHLLRDHFASSENDLDIPPRYKSIVYVYHKTSVSDDPQETIWVEEQYDFRNETALKKFSTIVDLDDPRGLEPQTYHVELNQRRGRLVISATNIHDEGENSSIAIIENPPLKAPGIGIVIHSDWLLRPRVSPTILMFTRDPSFYSGKDLNQEALEEVWKKGAKNQRYDYSLTKA